MYSLFTIIPTHIWDKYKPSDAESKSLARPLPGPPRPCACKTPQKCWEPIGKPNPLTHRYFSDSHRGNLPPRQRQIGNVTHQQNSHDPQEHWRSPHLIGLSRTGGRNDNKAPGRPWIYPQQTHCNPPTWRSFSTSLGHWPMWTRIWQPNRGYHFAFALRAVALRLHGTRGTRVRSNVTTTTWHMWNLRATGQLSNAAYLLPDVPVPHLHRSTLLLHNRIAFHRQDGTFANTVTNSPIPSLQTT